MKRIINGEVSCDIHGCKNVSICKDCEYFAGFELIYGKRSKVVCEYRRRER